MAKKEDVRLVWSDDPKDRARLNATPEKKEPVLVTGWTAVFRLEKAGRKGKTVTVLDQLPAHETFLKALCKELKARCGSGGTFEMTKGVGRVEIQGDQRAVIKTYFDQKAYRYKGM